MTIAFNGKDREFKVPERCGDFYLRNRQFETDEIYVMYTLFVLIGFTFLFLGLTIAALANIRFGRIYTNDLTEEEEKEITRERSNSESSQEQLPVLARRASLATEPTNLVFSDLWYSVRVGPKSRSHDNTVDLLKGSFFIYFVSFIVFYSFC
uniref:Uncharacterized protein n=1 Tax=Aplanochytrium stocchinoi TaxID=215587 RepID=A0A7S3PTI2_9STRA